MKLRNKETGEIRELSVDMDRPDDGIRVYHNDGVSYRRYDSLAGLNEYWEDVPEEPKEYWFIDYDGGIIPFSAGEETATDKMMKSIGNYFETEEEAEKAVEKLKAWTRLKGGGFEFMSCSYGHDKTTDDTGGWIRFRVNHLYDERYGCEVEKDLALLFQEVKNDSTDAATE